MRQANSQQQSITKEEAEQIVSRLSTDIFTANHILSLVSLWYQIKDRVDALNVILVDSADGQPDALILRKLINKTRSVHGLPPAEMYFVAGGKTLSFDYLNEASQATRPALEKFLESLHRRSVGKILIVTEYVYSGGTIKVLGQLAQKHGLDFEVAAVSADSPKEDYIESGIPSEIIQRLSVGAIGTKDDILKTRIDFDERIGTTSRSIKGKEHFEATFAPERIGKGGGPEFDSEAVKVLRNDIQIIADELSKRLL